MAFLLTFPVKLMALLMAAMAASLLWHQTTLSVLALTRIDPLPETRALMEASRYAEAAEYLDFFMAHDYVASSPEAQRLHQTLEGVRGQWRYQLSKLAEGLLQGSSDETVGQVASVVSDFMVIGDLRDLAHQGVTLAKGEDVDEVLVALASLGVLATGAQAASGLGTGASGGLTAPAMAGTTAVKQGLITLKAARRLGQLPRWLPPALSTTARRPALFSDINALARTRGGMRLLADTQNAGELRRAAHFATTFGQQGAALYRIGGKTAVQVTQGVGRLGKASILLAATFGQKGLLALDQVGALRFTKLITRSGKMVHKGDLVTLMAKLLSALPDGLLYAIIALAAWLWRPRRWRLASVRQGRPPRFRRRVAPRRHFFRSP